MTSATSQVKATSSLITENEALDHKSFHRNVTLRQEDELFVCHLSHSHWLWEEGAVWVVAPDSQDSARSLEKGANVSH